LIYLLILSILVWLIVTWLSRLDYIWSRITAVLLIMILLSRILLKILSIVCRQNDGDGRCWSWYLVLITLWNTMFKLCLRGFWRNVLKLWNLIIIIFLIILEKKNANTLDNIKLNNLFLRSKPSYRRNCNYRLGTCSNVVCLW
jgi:hypothetical protein